MAPEEKETPMNPMDKLDLHQVDFHVHTAESPSPGAIPLDGLIREAEERGLLCISITDHWKEDTDPTIFLEERKLIEESSSDLKIYLSAEVEILDEQATSPVDPKAHRKVLERMDFLGATLHLGEFLPEIRRRPMPKDKLGYIEYVHRKLMNMLRSELFDLLLHPTSYGLTDGVCPFGPLSFEDVPERWLDEFADAAAFYGKGIQINENTASSPPEGYDLFVGKLIRAGAKLTVGSDCHYLEHCVKGEEVGRNWPGRTERAVEVIRRCGGDKNLLWLPERR